MLNVLLQATAADSNGGDGFIVLAFFLIAVLFFVVLGYLIWSSKKEKKEDLDIRELNDEPIEENAGDFGQSEPPSDYLNEAAESSDQFGGYCVDPKDANLFISKKNDKLKIRYSDRKFISKDEAEFSTIFPHNISQYDTSTEGMKVFVPEVSLIEVRNSHTLIVHKSPASNWSDIKDRILSFLFNQLNNMYKD